MNNYFVYDGRARFDMDSALIVEAFQASTDKEAKKYFNKEYHGYDFVLTNANNKIIAQ